MKKPIKVGVFAVLCVFSFAVGNDLATFARPLEENRRCVGAFCPPGGFPHGQCSEGVCDGVDVTTPFTRCTDLQNYTCNANWDRPIFCDGKCSVTQAYCDLGTYIQCENPG